MYTLSIREGEGEVAGGEWGVDVVWNMRWFALANCPFCHVVTVAKKISAHDRKWERVCFFFLFQWGAKALCQEPSPAFIIHGRR